MEKRRPLGKALSCVERDGEWTPTRKRRLIHWTEKENTSLPEGYESEKKFA